jgi:hypothetical protein
MFEQIQKMFFVLVLVLFLSNQYHLLTDKEDLDLGYNYQIGNGGVTLLIQSEMMKKLQKLNLAHLELMEQYQQMPILL